MTEPHQAHVPTIRNEPLDAAPDISASHLIRGLSHFVRLVRQRKRVLLVALTAAAVLGSFYYATATRYYQSAASLLILQTGGDVLSSSSMPESSNPRLLSTYCELFKSGLVLDKTIERLPPEFRASFEAVGRDKWAALLATNLTPQNVRDTNIIEIQYRSKDPYTAKAVVTALLEAYFEFIDETNKGATKTVLELLSREKAQVEQALAEKEVQVLAVRQKVGDLGSTNSHEVSHPVVARAMKLNEALMEAQKIRLDRQASLASIEAALQNGDSLLAHLSLVETAVGRDLVQSALGTDANNTRLRGNLEQQLLADQAELQTLTKFYGAAHPRVMAIGERVTANQQHLRDLATDLDRRLNARIADGTLGPLLVGALRRSLQEAEQREATIQVSYEEAQQEAGLLTGDIANLELLTHDVTRLRACLDVLLGKMADVDLRQEHGDFRASVIKEPVANLAPISPQLSLVAAFFLTAGLLVGCTVIYAFDILDDRFRSPEEMQSQLGVPVLAMVRNLAGHAGEGLAGLQTYQAPDSAPSEAFRTLRTSLSFHAQKTERLVISSAEMGDGKTTVLANLAVSIAQSGKKTLLIDSDLRRPGLTDLLAMKGRAGLSEILQSQEGVAEVATRVLRRTPLSALDVIPSGRRRPNPAELISGPRLAELLAWAESNYDQVLVDSPPVLAASDAQLIGRLVDGVILVVDAKKNQRRAVIRAAESFQMLNVEVIGTIVNRVDPKHDSGYGYGYGNGYEYGNTGSGDAERPPAPEDHAVQQDGAPFVLRHAETADPESWDAPELQPVMRRRIA